MSNRWADGSVAGVDLEDAGGRPCRIDVIDAEAFQGNIVGDSVLALDLTVHTQLLDRDTKGIRFGIKIAQIPVAVMQDVVEAIETAMSGGASFLVSLTDDADVDDISAMCVPDYAALNGRLYSRGGMAAGYIKEVTMRFITTGPEV